MGLLVRRTGRVVLVVTVVVRPMTVILDLIGRLVAVVLVSVVALMGRLGVVFSPLVLVGVVILVLVTLAAAVVVLNKCSLCGRREDEQSGGGDGKHLDLAEDGGQSEERGGRTCVDHVECGGRGETGGSTSL